MSRFKKKYKVSIPVNIDKVRKKLDDDTDFDNNNILAMQTIEKLSEMAQNDSFAAMQQSASAKGESLTAFENAAAALQYTVGKFLPPVDTFYDIETTYPDALVNDRVQAMDTGRAYIRNNGQWEWFSQIDSGPVNEVDNRLSASLIRTDSKLSNITIDLKEDFGAVGDGLTDDTEAIQAAVDYAFSKGGAQINTSIGGHLITKPLLIKLVGPHGGYDFPPIIFQGQGNNASYIFKRGEEKNDDYDLDAAMILINGNTMNLTSSFSGIQFNNIKIINESNGAKTYGVYGYQGSRIATHYASFEVSTQGLPLEQRDRYAFYIYTAWMWSIEDTTFYGDYGFYNASGSTSLYMKNTYARTQKIAYHLAAMYSTIINTAGDYCNGLAYKFYYCNLTINNMGIESPNCDTLIEADYSEIVINSARLYQPHADQGVVFKLNRSNIFIENLRMHMSTQVSGNVGYPFKGLNRSTLKVKRLSLGSPDSNSATKKFKHFDTDSMRSTPRNYIEMNPDTAFNAPGLTSLFNRRDEYYDWYMENPQYPTNNMFFGLKGPRTNSKGDDVGFDFAGAPNQIFINSDFKALKALGWVRYDQSSAELRNGQNHYIPLHIIANSPSELPPLASRYRGLQAYITYSEKPKPIWWNGVIWTDAMGDPI